MEIIIDYCGWKVNVVIFLISRNRAIGSCSAVARVGGFFSLIVKLLQNYWKPAPMIIMGVATVVAGFLALAFPETVNAYHKFNISMLRIYYNSNVESGF